MSRRLIDAGIDVLRVSAIGSDRDAYHRWMSIDVFEQVRDNVRRFGQLNRDMGGHSEIHLYHLVTDVAREQQEVAAYRSNWIDYTGAFAEIWLMHNWSGGYETPYARHEMVPDPTPRSCGRPRNCCRFEPGIGRPQCRRCRMLYGFGERRSCRSRSSGRSVHR